MEPCPDGNGDTDPHIISLMGSSDLNLVDTSMLPSDPRAMMDLVRGGEQDEDSLSATFHTTFQQHASLGALDGQQDQQQHVTSPNNGHPLSALIRPSSSGPAPPLIRSPPINSHSLNQQSRLQSSVPLIQVGLISPQQGNHELASPPNDSTGGEGLPNDRGMPLPLHTPPLHHHQPQQHDLLPSYYPSSGAMTISRNYAGNGYTSGGVFSTFTTTHHHQQPPVAVLSPDHQHQHQPQPHQHQQHHQPPQPQQQHFAKRELLHSVYILPHLKQEPEEDFTDLVSDVKRPLSNDQITLEQSPYLSFANLNLNNGRIGLGVGGMRSGQRNPSGGEASLTQSPLISPLRPPSCGDVVCSSPSEVGMATRVHHQPQHTPYGLPSPPPPPPQMVLEGSLNNGRAHHTVPIHLQHAVQPQQQTPLQTHLFQTIQLHTTTLAPQHNQLHPQDVSLPGSQPLSLNLGGPYEDPLNSDQLSNTARNLSFTYGDILGPQVGAGASHSSFPQNVQYPIKNSGKNAGRKCSGSSGRARKDEEEDDQDENYSSDSASVNESEDETLVIDTSGSSIDGYECGECKQVCRTRGSLRKHLATEHLPNEPEPAESVFKDYCCPLSMCTYVTTHRDEYDKHLADHISDGWTPTGKKRHNKNPLQRHRYNKEEFQCPHCEYSCTVEKAFSRHLAAHDNRQDELEITDKVSCQICGKDRPSDAALRVHMKKHRKGKYYKCDICKFKSVQLKKLIQHRRMHTGEKPHLCPYCVYRAARRDNLRSHVRRMHKKNNMFCDTFTPRPLIVAQVEANQSAVHQRPPQHLQPQQQQQQHQQQQHRMLGQQQHHLVDRLQQHHHQQISPQGLGGGLPPQGLGAGSLSPHDQQQQGMTDHIQLPQAGILILPSPPGQHNLLSSPPPQ